MYSDQDQDWKLLAHQAIQETDPVKMLAIVSELNRVLDERETYRQQPPRSK